MHIFYCDDDREDIAFFTQVVENINPKTQVTTVTDPEEALEMLQSLTVPPQFIFFDANMPKLDGLECTIAVKRIKSLRKIPFIIISGGLDSHQIAAYNKLGVHCFVAKTNLDDLEETLRGILNAKEIIP